jgi:hypothetical protein
MHGRPIGSKFRFFACKIRPSLPYLFSDGPWAMFVVGAQFCLPVNPLCFTPGTIMPALACKRSKFGHTKLVMSDTTACRPTARRRGLRRRQPPALRRKLQ